MRPTLLILGAKEYPFGTSTDKIPGGGVETYVDDLAGELSKSADLIIITRKFRGQKSFEKKGAIEIHRLPWIPGRYFRTPSFILFTFILAKWLLLTRKIDIIYNHASLASFAGVLLGSLFGKPTVCRPAGFGFTQFPWPFSTFLYWMERFAYRRAARVVFHGEGELENYEELYRTNATNGVVIYTGFPVQKFLVKRSKRIEAAFGLEGEKVVTFVGRFHPVKGTNYLVGAMTQVKGKLLLVGDGLQRKELETQVNRLGLQSKVIFAGFRKDIPEILSVTDVFVVPSISEGLPTTLLEAMAAKVPCVVTDFGAPDEGLLVVPKRDSVAIAKAINKVLGNKSLRENMVKRAYSFVRKECTQRASAARHMKMFAELLS